MKSSKEKIKSIGLFLLVVAFAVLEFGLDMRRLGGGSKSAFLLLILLAGSKMIRDIKRAAKNTKDEVLEQKSDVKIADDLPEEPEWDPFAKATVSALGGLDWMLRKINPGYDPDAERNAKNVDTSALSKLDDMRKAGLIDEKEYQQRKKELAEK